MVDLLTSSQEEFREAIRPFVSQLNNYLKDPILRSTAASALFTLADYRKYYDFCNHTCMTDEGQAEFHDGIKEPISTLKELLREKSPSWVAAKPNATNSNVIAASALAKLAKHGESVSVNI